MGEIAMRVLFYSQRFSDICQEANLLHGLGVIPILANTFEQAGRHIKLKTPDLTIVDYPGRSQAVFDLLTCEDLSADQLVGVIPLQRSKLKSLLESFGVKNFILRPTTTFDYANRVLHLLGKPILKEARCLIATDAHIQSDRGYEKVEVIDLSTNGICLSAHEKKLMVNQFYILELNINDVCIRSTIKVIWKSGHLRGCSFEMMSHKERSLLVSFLIKLQTNQQVVAY
jgi:hypothetical protein